MRYKAMESKHKALLLIDGVVNLILGLLLILYPVGIVELLGLPPTETYFYAIILGAVLFGIGIALMIELYGYQGRFAAWVWEELLQSTFAARAHWLSG